MQSSKIRSLVKQNDVLLIFVASLLLYGISASIKINEQSKTPQYVYLAYSFLHGRADLVALPASKFDLIQFQDKYYVPGGITPALLLMPVVALMGLNVSDVFLGVIIGAINVALVYSLLGKLTETVSVRRWLTFLFATGTVHWWLASVGSVWFNAQIVAMTFMVIFVMETFRKNAWRAGLWLGLAALSRPPILFASVFYLLFVATHEQDIKLIARRLLPFGAMMLATVTIMLTYNFIRFGEPLDFGYGYVHGTRSLTNAFAIGGGFNVDYIPCNIYVSLFGLPNFDWNPLPAINDVCHHLDAVSRVFGKESNFFNPLGMSVFLTTPALLLIFRTKLRDDLVVPAWAGVIAVLVPLWMYHTTGWVQFGYRYVLDFMVFLIILLCCAIKRIGWLEKTLIGASVVMGAIGLYLMYYMTFGLKWHETFLKMVRIILSIIF